MNILFATSEVVPFAKTGGLADVCGALPLELAALGHQVAVIVPAYRGVAVCGEPLESMDITFEVPVGGKTIEGSLLVGRLPGSEVPVYFVRQDNYFDREGIYGYGGVDYEDNCERFVFFSRAVLEVIQRLQWDVDLLHVHDWTTCLIPAYLKVESVTVPQLAKIASLVTVHNVAYQGTFWHWDMLLTGLDWKYFNWHQMEFHGDLNFLKTGLVFADAINTVSPRYAEEIQTLPLGCGLQEVLTERRDVLSGIINGVDYTKWNPATDRVLATNYTSSDFVSGKKVCKRALQREFGLSEEEACPLVGFVGRLAGQKGLDIVIPVIREWVAAGDLQWVFLGTGEKALERALRELAAENPGRVGVIIDFSDPLAHRIEAGADMFIMPSKYEPCGLNQLYSLKYGTVPVVHETGGLADTVVDATEEALSEGTATGFSFEAHTSTDFARALQRARDCFLNHQDQWHQMISTGMRQDWSWRQSAVKYSDLYQKIVAQRQMEVLSS